MRNNHAAGQISNRRGTRLALLSVAMGVATCDVHADPTTTIITHGFSIDSKGAWVQAMAEAIIARASGVGSIYRYTDALGQCEYVAAAGADGSAQNIVLIFNWVPESDGPPGGSGPNWNYAQAAGDALYALLRAPSFAGAPDPKSLPVDLVSGRAVHFIGHSRGACVNSEAARRLGRDGVAVDQITTLDPHPVNGTLDDPYDYNWGDPYPVKWSNVAWADNYWRADGGGIFNGLDFDGIPLNDAFNTQLSESALNCCAYTFAHSDVHLWLHGTIDLSPTPCDGDQCINAQMRNTWWPGGFAVQGYYYSHLGGGSADRPGPLPPGTDPGNVSRVYGGAFDGGSYAGWVSHGGSIVNGQVAVESGNGYLRLGPGAAPAANHNRFFLHEDAAAVVIDSRVIAAGASESLELALIDVDGNDFALGAVNVDVAGAWIAAQSFPISPAVPRGLLYRLRMRVAGPAPIEAIVGVDNVIIELQPQLAGDVNGDGCVNVDDLLVVIGAWGDCPSGPARCPADVTGDGAVDVDDLLAVIGGWTPCG
jgi:hypothetical protein